MSHSKNYIVHKLHEFTLIIMPDVQINKNYGN